MATTLPESFKEEVSLESFDQTFNKLKDFLTSEATDCPKAVLAWLEQVYEKEQ